MNISLKVAEGALSRSGYDVVLLDEQAATFESDTVLGFLLAFKDPAELLAQWASRADEIISRHQFQLRAAGEKGWNAYLVMLAEAPANKLEMTSLSLVEEDLQGTRKIARAGVNSDRAAQAALLSLLPLQSKPVLELVDMEAEVSARSGDLHPEGVRAFLSEAEDSLVLQMLGESI